MNSIAPENAAAARRRRRQATAIKESLRELSNQLALLNRRVSAQVDLRDTDLDCLELVARHGPLSPSALAHQGPPPGDCWELAAGPAPLSPSALPRRAG